MSVSLRLTRMGSKKKPFYRIIAVDSRVERDGKYIEQIGIYNPLTGEKKVNSDIALKWLSNGAKPSQTVRSIFSEQGVMKAFHESKQKPKIEEKENKSKKVTAKKVVTKKAVAKKTVKAKTSESSNAKAKSTKK